MARFQDIPQFTKSAGYMVNVGLDYLARHYWRYVTKYGLDVSPDFQRGYVWTQQQKIRFVEYMLRGGVSGLDVYMNCPSWQSGRMGPEYPEAWFVLVDGKQRLDAALGFLNNEFPVFGAYFREYTDRPRITQCNFRWHVNDLQTREECLQWYLDLNTGGTVHTDDELSKVRDLLKAGGAYQRPQHVEIVSNAHLDRAIFEEVVREEQEAAAKRAANEAMIKPAPKKRARR
jgi:hypothetical protein